MLERFDSSPYSLGPDRELRCHELTRAVERFIPLAVKRGQVLMPKGVPYHPLNVTLYDGKYSIVDHSWLEILAESPEGLCSLYILDVYTVGQLPQVQLLDIAFSLPHRASYRPQARRDDIDMDVVNLVSLDLTLQIRTTGIRPIEEERLMAFLTGATHFSPRSTR